MKYSGEVGSCVWDRQVMQREGVRLPEANNKDALPVLGRPSPAVNDPVAYLVTEPLLQDLLDDLEGAPSVMTQQVLYILQEEGCRAVMANNSCDIEEQCALRLVSKTMRAIEGLLLGDPCKGERLAREPREENVEHRDILFGNVTDIARNGMVIVGEIGTVGDL